MMEEFYARRTLIGATLAAGRPAFDAERPGRSNQLDEAARAEALRLAKELAVQAPRISLSGQPARFVTMLLERVTE